jgi:hypothetical protein
MRSLIALTLVAALWPAAADAQIYSFPTTEGTQTKFRKDHNGAAVSFQDFSCGSKSYDGHKGSDISVTVGSPVRAARTGTVTSSMDGFGTGYFGSSDGGGWGNHVFMSHGNNDVSIYAHLLRYSGIPTAGASLTCGQSIGQSGMSGNVDGAHLHFEARIGNTAVDPFAGPCSQPTSMWNDQNGEYPKATCSPVDPQPTAKDEATLVEHLTFPDGSQVARGQSFNKSWRIKNSGANAWDGSYSFDRISGPDIGPASVELNLNPGAVATVSVILTPTELGQAELAYRMSKDGMPFGDTFYARFEVVPADGSVDGDGDGFAAPGDCNDGNPDVYPGAPELCDGQDNSCSGDSLSEADLSRVCCDMGIQYCQGGSWGQCDVFCDELSPTAGSGDVFQSCSASGGSRGSLLWLLTLGLVIRRKSKR